MLLKIGYYVILTFFTSYTWKEIFWIKLESKDFWNKIALQVWFMLSLPTVKSILKHSIHNFVSEMAECAYIKFHSMRVYKKQTFYILFLDFMGYCQNMHTKNEHVEKYPGRYWVQPHHLCSRFRMAGMGSTGNYIKRKSSF